MGCRKAGSVRVVHGVAQIVKGETRCFSDLFSVSIRSSFGTPSILELLA